MSVIVGGCLQHKIVAVASCFFVVNDFAQNYPSLVTHTTVATTHVAYTSHIPRRVPHPCPCTTSIFKTYATSVFKRTQPAYSNIATCCKLMA